MTKAPTTKSDIDEEEMMLLKKKIAEMEDDISKYHINVRSPIELIKDFLKTLINEDGEDILEKKYIFLKKHYLDLYKEHQQKYRYEGIGMAEKFLLNYLLPDNNDSVLSIMDISDWITSIENFMRSSNYQIFTIAIAGEKEYIESTIDENLIPEHIKAIKDRDFSYYDYPDDDLELLHFRRNGDFMLEITKYIVSTYRSMFREISNLFIDFLQKESDKAKLKYVMNENV